MTPIIVLITGLLLPACNDAPTADTAACPGAPAVERLDVPAGYRVLQAPVNAPWLEDPRQVPVGVWTPTDDATGVSARYIEAVDDPSSWVDAEFADPGAGCALPLVVYSHGSQAWGGNASPLVRHLVAQGWVAAAPDHLGNTLIDNDDPRRVAYSLTRMADVSATIDVFEALSPDDPLYGRVDTSRVLVLGHSFGGQTAWLLAGPTIDGARIADRCASAELGCTDAEIAAFSSLPTDPRVAAVVPMDGTAGTDLVAAEGWESASLPILYLARSQDGDEEAFERSSAADVIWGRFEGACHETFTATPLPCDFDKEEGLDAVAAYVSAFAAVHVSGASGAPWDHILDGSTVVDERVEVRSHE